ncbi:MAG: peptide MFS transporter [Candidatus Andeanibacterium colombiense]|uniref:Peptide MFS transporter n=1 Tax=Candidatus Andeanibacterium colombiense TaxID=3121345 RepID=A0AAJ5X4I3_9SPHN|nr:MAG: peptide MFS transporter [Sphingomonadaceae bacterium]
MRIASFSDHPPGLFILFATEAWERFAYYGIRALLILFMTSPLAAGGLEFDTATAGAIYGVFTASVYLMSLPGGWLADKLLGQQRAVLWGGLLIGGGGLLLAVPGGLPVFRAGLLVISLGVGLLKPNVSVMVGDLYPPEASARRDAGFSIFYFGIYLGAFAAPLVVGTLGESFGYRLGFAATGVAMLGGTLFYARIRGRLGAVGRDCELQAPEERRRGWIATGSLGAAMLLTILAVGLLRLDMEAVAACLGAIIGALSLGFFGLVLRDRKLDEAARRRVIAIFVLCACVALFISGLEQAGSTMNLFARDFTDRSFMGGFFAAGQHPASWYQSVSPLYVLLLSPVFAAGWMRLSRRGLEPSAPVKFGLSLILLGASFALMALAVTLAVQHGMKAAPGWLILVYLLQTLGELCIGPIGLSAITGLAPRSHAGRMMGMWFLATAAGSLIAGLVGGWMGSAQMAAMPARFLGMAGIGVVAGIAMILLSGAIVRLAASRSAQGARP